MTSTVQFHLVSYGEHNVRHKIGPCAWPYFDLLSIREGEVCLRVMGNEITLGERHSILLYPITHFQGYAVTEIARTSVIHFEIKENTSALPALYKNLLGKHHGYDVYDTPYSDFVKLVVDRLVRLAQQTASPFIHDMRVALLTLILGELQPRPHERPPSFRYADNFESLIRWMRENLHHPITLEVMAARVGLSCSQFRSLFREYAGCSPKRFLNDMRIDEAKRLLQQTQIPIKEIALRLGYRDITHFYRAFKTGAYVPPNDYRSRNIIRG